MPRKTKKQKIIAEYRKKIKKLEHRTVKQNKKVISSNEIQVRIDQDQVKLDQIPLPQKSKKLKISESILKNTKLIKQDLKKTLILSTLAISFEFMLYWLIEIK